VGAGEVDCRSCKYCNFWPPGRDWYSLPTAKALFTVRYVSSTQADATDFYNWVRSYAIATVAGGKRVTAVVNPAWPSDPDKAANIPYAATNALAWTLL